MGFTTPPNTPDAEPANAAIAVRLLTEGLGKGNTKVVQTLVRDDYIQHSASALDGCQGVLDFIDKAGPLDVAVHRVLVDKDLVATHNTYTFPDGKSMVAFDVFRVEGGQLAEHWDALQEAVPAAESANGNSMVDGPSEVVDEDATEANRALVAGFIDTVMMKGQFDRLTEYASTETYIQHNPAAGNGLEGLAAFVKSVQEQGMTFGYTRSPLVVARGNFVLVASEGFFGPKENPPFAVFFDLFRVDNGKIVEHWDVIPTPAPNPETLPHSNGLF